MRSLQKSVPAAPNSGNSFTTASGSQRTTPRKVAFDPDSLSRSDDDGPRDLLKIPLSVLHRGDKMGVGESLEVVNIV